MPWQHQVYQASGVVVAQGVTILKLLAAIHEKLLARENAFLGLNLEFDTLNAVRLRNVSQDDCMSTSTFRNRDTAHFKVGSEQPESDLRLKSWYPTGHKAEAQVDGIPNAANAPSQLRGETSRVICHRNGGAINVEGPFTPRIVDKMSHEQAFEAKYLCKSG